MEKTGGISEFKFSQGYIARPCHVCLCACVCARAYECTFKKYHNAFHNLMYLSSDIFLRWVRNGTEIDLESDYRYSLIDGTFIISNPSEVRDSGLYQCLATNTFGSILSREATLQFACE